MFLATGLVAAGQDPAVGVRLLRRLPSTPGSGPVRSPWSTDHVAGASSAGSAALVAAGVVPIAHANDGGGSIRIPAAVNGLVGLKPTRDRLAQDKVHRDMPVRIVSDGVLTRSVRDTAAFLREAEKVYRALQLPPVGDITRPGRGPAADRRSTPPASGRPASPEVDRADPRRRRPPRGAWATTSRRSRRCRSRPRSPTTSSSTGRCSRCSSSAPGAARHGPSWDPDRLDNLTLGLARHCRAASCTGSRGDPAAAPRPPARRGASTSVRRRC